MRVRAAIAHSASEPLTIEWVELDNPGPGEVRVRIEACGICRSDLSALDGKETVEFPVVLGHEASGTVTACGDGVSTPRPGDSVILSWSPACGLCAACRRHEVHLCEQISMTTGSEGPMRWNGRPVDRFMGLGAFAEEVVVPANMAVPVSANLPSQQRCLIGCGVATGFGAAANTAAIRWGETVAVFGCGGIGLAAIQGARIAGAEEIFAIDPNASRLEIALRLGATHALTSARAATELIERTAGGVDVALECVGQTDVMRECFLSIRPGGRAVIVGLPDIRATLELPAILLLREKTIKGSMYGSMNPATDFSRIVSLAESGRLQLEPLAERERPFEEVNEGLADMRAGTVSRVVLRFPEFART